MMHHFFVDSSRIKENKIYIEGADVNHIRNVLRMRAGEDARISDGEGNDYLCCLESTEQGIAVFDILKKQENDTELPARLYLFQGVPKGDKMEWIVQKAVELGVYQILPVSTKRSVVKLDANKAKKKRERWQAIAKGAAEQSGRGMVPEVTEILKWQEALEAAKDMDVLLIPYELADGMEKTKMLLESVKPGQAVGIFIGPEGGFESWEVEQAESLGALAVTLGRRILRTETAGLAVLSVLMYHLEGSCHNLIVSKNE